MLCNITNTDLDLTTEDPVRPSIPMSWRQQQDIYAWVVDGVRQATICVAWCDSVPDSEEVLLITPRGYRAVAYSIWSHYPGAGAKLIQALQQKLRTDPLCEGIYTLSPPTDMARKFHLANGARVYRLNATTVNYQYAHDTIPVIQTAKDQTDI
jgi:hypothetical protein